MRPSSADEQAYLAGMPKILHSSDWHLGARLHEQSRQEDHTRFLAWMRATLREERPDAFILAGDIFDSSLPGTTAQQQYYDFLGDLAQDQSCLAVVIIAGNHDSPALLNAPAALLRRLNVHVIGAGPAFDQDKTPLILRLPSRDGTGLVIGAIPFLRERDLRSSQSGEGPDEIDAKLREGLKRYFSEVYGLALAARQQSEPVILTGHLTLGLPELDADGSERKTYIGKLETAPGKLVPATVDYLALGHIHKPQSIGLPHFCYSGSPLPMSFAEAGQQKRIVAVSWQAGVRLIRDLAIPCFRRLVRLRGDWESLSRELVALKSTLNSEELPSWLEITLESRSRLIDLESRVDALIQGSPALCLRCQQKLDQNDAPAGSSGLSATGLEDLSPGEVFELLLQRKAIDEEQRPPLRHCFATALQRLDENQAPH
ncbi:MAG: hypothetical protein RL095_2544 [Verrucomicrobiota bacterium]|jgi:exonuclease SbcD